LSIAKVTGWDEADFHLAATLWRVASEGWLPESTKRPPEKS
jgi:hypothetical protein